MGGLDRIPIKWDLTLLNEVLKKMPASYASVSAMPNITMEFAIFVGVIA